MVLTMSRPNFCRLCLKICKDHKNLYDDIDVYQITVKYFNPMFLNLKHHLTAICLECWCQMVEFYNFQQSVEQVKTRLQNDQLPHNQSLCLLCVTKCNSIFNNDGISEIVAKYFDMKFLNNHHLGGICLKCWSNIYDFYQFQETVMQAQTVPVIKEEICPNPNTIKSEMIEMNGQLQNYVHKSNEFSNRHNASKEDSCQVIVKSERPDSPDYSNIGTVNSQSTTDYVIKEEPEFFSRPELELIDVHSESQCSSEEEILESGFSVKYIDSPSVDEGLSKGETDEKSKKRKITKSHLFEDFEYESYKDDIKLPLYHQSYEERKKTIKKLDEFIAKWRPTLECVICSASCATFSLLEKHFESEHPTEQCHIFCCQCKFKSRYYLEEHIRFHIDPNTFKCQICGHCNTTRLNLKRHMEYWHSKNRKLETAAENEGSLKCSECGNPAKTMGALRKHMQRHEAKRKFKCAICDKGFRGRNDLRTHLAGHSQTVACPQCLMVFKNVSQMNAHRAKEHKSKS